MQFKVGNKVRFLDEVGEGKILRIDGVSAIIEDEHGFEVSYNLSKLVLASNDGDYNVDELDAHNQKEIKLTNSENLVQVELRQFCRHQKNGLLQ